MADTTYKLPVVSSGYYADFSLSYPLSSNYWADVDDSTANAGYDSDSTYIYETAPQVGDKNTFMLLSTVFGGQRIKSVTIHYTCRYDGTLGGSWSAMCRLNGTDKVNTTGTGLNSSYTTRSESIAPPAGGSWSDYNYTSSDGIEVGINIVTYTGGKVVGSHRLTQVYAEIVTEDIPVGATVEARISETVDLIALSQKRLTNDIDSIIYSSERLANKVRLYANDFENTVFPLAYSSMSGVWYIYGESSYYAAIDDNPADDGTTYIYNSDNVLVAGNNIDFSFGGGDIYENDQMEIYIRSLYYYSGLPSTDTFTYRTYLKKDGTKYYSDYIVEQVNGSAWETFSYKWETCPWGTWGSLANITAGLEVYAISNPHAGGLVKFKVTQLYLHRIRSYTFQERVKHAALLEKKDWNKLSHIISNDKTILDRLPESLEIQKLGVERLSNDLNQHYILPSRCCNVVGIDTDWSPEFFSNDWYKRRLIECNNPHSRIESGNLVDFELFTGNEIKSPTAKGVLNESVQHSATEITYDPIQDISYITWLGYGLTSYYHVYATYYNHSTETWSDTILDVATTATTDDTHRYPVIFLDSDGYLHYFYNSYISPVLQRRSRNPVTDDPDNFALLASTTNSIGNYLTYPRIIEDTSGNMYVFGRRTDHGTNSHFAYVKSSDKGRSWSSNIKYVAQYENAPSANPVIYIGGVMYDSAFVSTGRCHTVLNWMTNYGSTTERRGRAMTHIFSDDFINWYEMTASTPEGVYIGRTVDTADSTDMIMYEKCRHVALSGDGVWDTPPFYHSNTQSLILDRYGRPAFLYFAPWEYQDNRESDIYLAHWNSSGWDKYHLNDVAGSPRMLSHRNGGVIYEDGDNFNVYYFGFPSGYKYFGGEVVRCHGTNYGDSWVTEWQTKHSGYGAGMMSRLDYKSGKNKKLILLSRCKDLFLYNDDYYPFSQRDGDDVRIVRHSKTPGGSYSYEMINKIIPDRFQAQDTLVTFPISSPVPINAPYHAYNRHYVYYANPLTSTSVVNVDSVYSFYEGFEGYTTGSNLSGNGDWSGGSWFQVISCTSLGVWESAHTNKIYSGAQSCRLTAPDVCSHELEVSSSWVEFKVWREVGGGIYLELFDTATKKFVRCGANTKGAYYCSGDGTWTTGTPNFVTGHMNDFVIKLVDSGISFWLNGTVVATNIGEVTHATHIRLGGISGYSPNVSFDHIAVYPYSGSEPSVPLDLVYNADLGEEEGEANFNWGRLSNIAQARYFRTNKIAQDIDKFDIHKIEKIAQSAIVNKVDRERLVHSSVGEKSEFVRLSELIINDKIMLTRVVEDLASNKIELIRLCETILSNKTELDRLVNNIYNNKKNLSRLVEAIQTDKYVRERLTELVSVNKKDYARIIEDTNLDKIILDRISESLETDKQVWNRIVQAAMVDKAFRERISNIIVSDKSILERLSETINSKKYIETRLSEVVSSDKTSIIRLANLLFGDKTLTARLINTIISDKYTTERVSELIALEAKEYERVADILLGDKILLQRISQDLDLEDVDIERISEILDLDKEEIIRLCNIALMDKSDILRLSQDLQVSFDKFIRICHYIATDKEVVYRINHKTPLKSNPVVRLGQILGLDKTTVSRLIGDVTLEASDYARVVEYLKTNKTLTTRLAQMLNMKATEYYRIAQSVVGDKSLMVRLSEDLDTDKTLTERLSEYVPFSKIQQERLSHWLELDAEAFIRITELLDLNKYQTQRLTENLSLRRIANFERISEILSFNKITTIRIPNEIPLSKFFISRLAMSSNKSKHLVSRLAQDLAAEISATDRLGQVLEKSKTFLIRLSNALTVSYIEVARLAHAIGATKHTSNRIAHVALFFVADFNGLRIDNVTLDILKLSGVDIDSLNLKSISVKTMRLYEPNIKILRIVNATIKDITLDNTDIF